MSFTQTYLEETQKVVAGLNADTEDEEPPAALAHGGEDIHHFFNGRDIEAGDDLLCLFEICLGETHARE